MSRHPILPRKTSAMRISSCLLLAGAVLASAATPFSAARAQEGSMGTLLQELRQARAQEAERDRERIEEFLERTEERQAMRDQAVAERNAARARRDELQAAFDANEESLAELETELEQRTGEFGEVFGVIRQVAGDARSTIRSSLISSQYPERLERLQTLASSDRLPSIGQIDWLWTTMLEEMVATSEVASYEAEIIQADGEATQADVTRVGPFNAMVGERFLQFTPETQELSMLPRQPDGRWQSLAGNVAEADPGTRLVSGVVDPSRGAVLGLLIQKPNLLERIQQGKLVGYVVLFIGLVGLLIALERFVSLGRIERRIRLQRKDIEHPNTENPLGRVLTAYYENQDVDTETLQLKLDEAILADAPPLERGLSTVKILAAVAPLLGLLGTVVGMIATFQAITLFGTGDPKLMAGGISQALVTTVLGLVVAVPLILLHSILAGRSRKLIQTLEYQASGIVAQHAEKAHGHA